VLSAALAALLAAGRAGGPGPIRERHPHGDAADRVRRLLCGARGEAVVH